MNANRDFHPATRHGIQLAFAFAAALMTISLLGSQLGLARHYDSEAKANLAPELVAKLAAARQPVRQPGTKG